MKSCATGLSTRFLRVTTAMVTIATQFDWQNFQRHPFQLNVQHHCWNERKENAPSLPGKYGHKAEFVVAATLGGFSPSA